MAAGQHHRRCFGRAAMHMSPSRVTNSRRRVTGEICCAQGMAIRRMVRDEPVRLAAGCRRRYQWRRNAGIAISSNISRAAASRAFIYRKFGACWSQRYSLFRCMRNRLHQVASKNARPRRGDALSSISWYALATVLADIISHFAGFSRRQRHGERQPSPHAAILAKYRLAT